MLYEKYGGTLNAYSGGNGGGVSTDAKIDKSILSLGFHPLKRNVFNHFHVHLGIVLSILLYENFSGSTHTNFAFDPSLSTSVGLKDKYENYNSAFNLGFKGGVSYDIIRANKIILFLHYSY